MLEPYRRRHLFGLMIETPFDLPGSQAPTGDGPCDVVIGWHPETAEPALSPGRLPAPALPGAPVAGRTDTATIYGWPGEMMFLIQDQGDRIDVICRPGRLPSVPGALVGDPMGILLFRRGLLCLHAAAVVMRGRTHCFMGATGAGKSTLAAALVARGGLVAADDLIAISRTGPQVCFLPGTAGLRLTEETARRFLPTGTEGLAPLPSTGKWWWQAPSVDPADKAELALDEIHLLTRQTGDMYRPDPVRRLHLLINMWHPAICRSFMTTEIMARFARLAEHLPLTVHRVEPGWDGLLRLAEEIGG
ncbi:hypothetical protein [Tistrella mobilis]|nr:hypothetical protein [Tistrella mobilis]